MDSGEAENQPSADRIAYVCEQIRYSHRSSFLRFAVMGSTCIHPGIIVALCIVVFFGACFGLYFCVEHRGTFRNNGSFTGAFVVMAWMAASVIMGIAAALAVGLPLGLVC